MGPRAFTQDITPVTTAQFTAVGCTLFGSATATALEKSWKRKAERRRIDAWLRRAMVAVELTQ